MRATRLGVWPVLLLALLAVLATRTTPADAAITQLRGEIDRTSKGNGVSSSTDVESKIAHIVESTEVIHGLQAQVNSVTRSLDTFLNEHAADSQAQHLDHDQIGQILATLQRLTASQKEIEERNARQIEQDHANLLQLIETQKRQQAMLTQELAHSKQLETQLAQLRQEQEQAANQHMAQQELANSMHLEHDLAHQSADLMDEPTFSLMEMHADAQAQAHGHPDLPHLELRHAQHAEHDIDLAHTMDHGEASALELQSEAELGAAAARASGPDPARYSSSADYLAAMDSVDAAVEMTPQQMQAFGERTLGAHEVGTPDSPHGLHSMSEIDSLIQDGAGDSHEAEFEFHPRMLHNPKLAEQLSALQDEESIQQAMVKAQAKIRAIAAELEKHANANGGDHSPGVEIDMVDMGTDEMHF